MRKKYEVKYIVISFVTLLLVALNLYQFNDKQKYIDYMSKNLTYDLGNMNRSILMSNHVLNRIISTKELNREDANYLEAASRLIAKELQDYHQIAMHDLDRISPDEISRDSEKAAFDILNYFVNINSDFPSDKETMSLNEKQLEKINEIKHINDIWRREVEIHAVLVNPNSSVNDSVKMFLEGEYLDIYKETSIAKDDWVELLVELSNRTEKYLNEQFEYGLGNYLSMN